jgi:hypothetical protein
MQAVAPVLIVLFAFPLVHLAGATRELGGQQDRARTLATSTGAYRRHLGPQTVQPRQGREISKKPRKEG